MLFGLGLAEAPERAEAASAEPHAAVLRVARPDDPVHGQRLAWGDRSFHWIGRSAFNLLGNPDWQEYVDGARARGYTGLRVWVAGEGPRHEIPDGEEGRRALARRLEQLPALLAGLRDRGMAIELTLFNGESFSGGYFDPDDFDDRAEAYVRDVLAILSDCETHPGVLLEIANEPRPDLGRVAQRFLDDALRLIRAVDRCGRPVTPGEEVPGGDYRVHHHAVDAGWDVLQYRELVAGFEAGLAGAGGPQLQDEPVDGYDSRVWNVPAASDPAIHRRAIWLTAFGGGYPTFHENNGICTHPYFDPNPHNCGGNCDGRDDDGSGQTCDDGPGDRDFCAPGDDGCDSYVPGIGEEAIPPFAAFVELLGGLDDTRPTDDPYDPRPGPLDFVGDCGAEGAQCFGLLSQERPLRLVYAWWRGSGAAPGTRLAVELRLPPGRWRARWLDPADPDLTPLSPGPGGDADLDGGGHFEHRGGRVRLGRPPALRVDAVLVVDRGPAVPEAVPEAGPAPTPEPMPEPTPPPTPTPTPEPAPGPAPEGAPAPPFTHAPESAPGPAPVPGSGPASGAGGGCATTAGRSDRGSAVPLLLLGALAIRARPRSGGRGPAAVS